MKRVSIITPITRNSNPNNILNLLFSLTQQITENKYEIFHILIICDPCNKKLDKLLSQLNLYKFIKVLNINTKNINKARNFAIKSINSDFVLHLETTDIIHPYFILSMLNQELKNETNKIIISNWKLLIKQNIFKIKVNFNSEKIKYVNNISNSYICPYSIANKYLFDENLFLGFDHWDLLLRYVSNNNKFRKIDKYGFFKGSNPYCFFNCSFKEYKLIIKYFYDKYPNLYKKSLFQELKIFIGFFNNINIKYNLFGDKYNIINPNFYKR